MPELPEVETTVNTLKKKIIGRRITDVWFDWPKLIKKPKPEEFKKRIIGRRIEKISRRAKNILFELDQQQLLLIHQKMTGHLLIGKWQMRQGKWESVSKGPLQEKVNDYLHLMFKLDDGRMLGLSDLRKFAKILFGPKKEIENSADLQSLGPEPLSPELNFEKFKSLIKAEKRKIKPILMDQEVIAGIGNIYSDEILWRAKIHPAKPAEKLSERELKNLFLAMNFILKKAVRLRGTSTSDYRDPAGRPGNYTNSRLVYQRAGQPCRRCGTKISRLKIGGRTAHFCPKCQK